MLPSSCLMNTFPSFVQVPSNLCCFINAVAVVTSFAFLLVSCSTTVMLVFFRHFLFLKICCRMSLRVNLTMIGFVLSVDFVGKRWLMLMSLACNFTVGSVAGTDRQLLLSYPLPPIPQRREIQRCPV